MFASRLLPRRLQWPAHSVLRQTRPITLPPQSTPRRPPPLRKPPHADKDELRAAKRRQVVLTIGAVTSMITLYVLATQSPHYQDTLPHPPIKPGSPVHLTTQAEKHAGVELVSSGTSSVPDFPKHLRGPDGVEYTLIGLGVRTVSFLSIQVYVVGLYVSTHDLPKLSTRLLERTAPPGATSTTVSERENLRSLLLSPSENERVFAALLTTDVASALRIVPTRNTDFAHLRDGWVRSISARAKLGGVYEEPGWIEALDEFKRLFGGRGSVPRRGALLLVRDAGGALRCYFDAEGRVDGEVGEGTVSLGVVEDRRVSEALWLGYFAGKKVASAPARISVVEGLVDLVERPVGSVV